MPTPEFEEQLVSLMPKLRVWALGMTRNHAAADDLVQEVAAKALAANNAFEAGTNFGAWMHRIMVNQFITGIRSHRNLRRHGINAGFADDEPTHEDRTALRELGWAVNRLPTEQERGFAYDSGRRRIRMRSRPSGQDAPSAPSRAASTEHACIYANTRLSPSSWRTDAACG